MEKKKYIRKGVGEMKKDKVREFRIDKIPRNMCTYVLKIKHDYQITQFYRTMERFADKLLEYDNFVVVRTDENKNTKTYTMEIEGKLPIIYRVKSRLRKRS